MVSELASSPEAREFESWSDETKDNKIVILLLLREAHSIKG